MSLIKQLLSGLKKKKKLSTVDILKAARSDLERGWTQGTYARDKKGHSVFSESKSAVAWCAWGAMRKLLFNGKDYWAVALDEIDNGWINVNRDWKEAVELLKKVIGINHLFEIVAWNDDENRTKEDVLQTFDKAIVLGEL